MGRATGVKDSFALVLGSKRGAKNPLSVLVTGTPQQIKDEHARLDQLLNDSDFALALQIVRFSRNYLTQHNISSTSDQGQKIEAFEKLVASYLVWKSDNCTDTLIDVLDWGKGDMTPRQYVSLGMGLQDQMIKIVLASLADCPDDWQEWMYSNWEKELPSLLTKRLKSDSWSAARHIGYKQLEKTDALPKLAKHVNWSEVAHVALNSPRPYFRKPLTTKEKQTCKSKAKQQLMFAITDAMETFSFPLPEDR